MHVHQRGRGRGEDRLVVIARGRFFLRAGKNRRKRAIPRLQLFHLALELGVALFLIGVALLQLPHGVFQIF